MAGWLYCLQKHGGIQTGRTFRPPVCCRERANKEKSAIVAPGVFEQRRR